MVTDYTSTSYSFLLASMADIDYMSSYQVAIVADIDVAEPKINV